MFNYYEILMKVQQLQMQLHAVFHIWKTALDGYTEDSFLWRISEESWSIGQVYNHLLVRTIQHPLKQAQICLNSNENSHKGKTIRGKTVMGLNWFPPVKLKTSPSPEFIPKQPSDRMEVKIALQKLILNIDELVSEIEKSMSKGKTYHSAFGYLSAAEWCQYIKLNFQHHLHQKARIDKCLKLLNYDKS